MLKITAMSASELSSTLGVLLNGVPPSLGRMTVQSERAAIVAFLSVLVNDSILEYPLELVQQDRPDFALEMNGRRIGIECVEAASNDWKHILAIRDRDYPEAIVSLQPLIPGSPAMPIEAKVAIANGAPMGPPWTGHMAERQWALGINKTIEAKVKKLAAGLYGGFDEYWLLIVDGMSLPVFTETHKNRALQYAESLLPSFTSADFQQIFVQSRRSLIFLVGPSAPRMLTEPAPTD
jgi:hypothetical protein